MKTEFQRWLKKRRDQRAAPKDRQTNPLGLRVGSPLIVDLTNYDDLTSKVQSVRRVSRIIGDEEFLFVDYWISAKDHEGGEFEYGLRCFPRSQTPGCEDPQILLLTPILEHEYDPEIEKSLELGLGVDVSFEEEEGEDTPVDQHWEDRIEGASLPYDCVVKTTESNDPAEKNEQSAMTFWDFERQIELRNGSVEVEYLFVEIDDSGYTSYFQATEIDPSAVITRQGSQTC